MRWERPQGTPRDIVHPRGLVHKDQWDQGLPGFVCADSEHLVPPITTRVLAWDGAGVCLRGQNVAHGHEIK